MRTVISIVLTLAALLSQPASSQGLPTWTIVPVLSIESDGTPPTEFSRIVAAMRLSDGRIAVANGATNDVRIFDANGKYARTFGRSGSGPGEFRSIGWIGRAGDTAFFHDYGLKRIMTVLLGIEPRTVETLPMQVASDRGSIYVNGRLDDGRWIIETLASPSWDMANGYRVPLSVGWIDRNADGKINWLAQLPGMSIFAYHPSGSVGKGSVVGAGAFTPWVYAASTGPTAWFGDSFADSLIMIGAGGKPTVAHLPIPRRRITAQIIAKARDARLTTARDARDTAATRAMYSAANVPNHLPFFESLRPGPGGELWVQEASVSGTDAVRYLVLAPNGSPRAWVNTPAGVRIMDVGLDHVVGVQKDDDGVESVRVYRLTRR